MCNLLSVSVFSPATMQTAIHTEKVIQEFLLTVKDCCRGSPPYPKWNEEDLRLQAQLRSTIEAIHEALCDNVDTRSALNAIKSLVGSANVYIQQFKGAGLNAQLLKSIAT